MHVPMALKEQVWGRQFVDFAALLRDNAVFTLTHDASSAMTLAVEGNQVVVKPASAPKKKIDSIDKWTSAFHAFMSIYTERHPGRCAELLKYAEIVKSASLQFPGFGWRSYDEQFCLRQAANPARSWAELDMELWVTVAAASALVPVHASAGNHGNVRSIFNQGRAGTGYQVAATHVCFAFNSDKGCNWQRCRFSHRCKRCNMEGHGITTCNVVKVSNVRFNANSNVRSVRNGPRNFSSQLSAHSLQHVHRTVTQQAGSRVAKGHGEQKGAAQTMQVNFRAPNAN